MLIRNHRQEALSRAFIQAIAGHCGMSCSFRDFDYGVDVTVHEIKRREKRSTESGFSLEIQAKSVCGPPPVEEAVAYDLNVKNYEDLRDPDNPKPRVLVLLVLPDEEQEWLALTEEQLVLRRCAYWLSLKGAAAVTNKGTVRVQLPRQNVFSVAGLQFLFALIRAGEDLC